MTEDVAILATEPTEPGTVAHDRVSAVYESHAATEAAVRALAKSGFDMKKLSIIGRDYPMEEGVVGFNKSGDRIKSWGKTGAFWGGLWGLLFGSALFVIPGIGPLFVPGPLAGWIDGALEGAAVFGGMSALGARRYGIGIPKDSILNYETQIKAVKFFVIAHGPRSQVEITQARLENAEYHNGTTRGCCSQ